MTSGAIRTPRSLVDSSGEGVDSVRVALINDGMYPYQGGVGGTWCHRLIRGLPEHAFHVIAITDREPATSVFQPPTNALTATSITLGGHPTGPNRGRGALRHRRTATHAAVLMCRSMLEDTPHSVAMFRSALRRLVASASEGTHPLHGVPLGAVLLDAWKAAGLSQHASLPRPALPTPTAHDAQDAAELLERAVRPLATTIPMTDLNHAVDGGLAALVSLGAKWRTGTPFVLTEHHSYLNAPLLDYTTGRPAVRAVLLRFFRALARLAYTEASVVVVPTSGLRRWALDHGAHRDKVSVVPYGVDPHNCPTIRGEPVEPIITWLGPPRDLVTMLDALTPIRVSRPDTRLIVAGPARPVDDPRHDAVTNFLGPVNHRRSAYATGQIVVLSGNDPSMPYGLIEAMMCGRPTICLDDGTLAPLAGMGAMVVPSADPAILASACLTLLGSPDRRRELSEAAGARARRVFGLRVMIDRFREAYDRAGRDTADETERIAAVVALAV